MDTDTDTNTETKIQTSAKRQRQRRRYPRALVYPIAEKDRNLFLKIWIMA